MYILVKNDEVFLWVLTNKSNGIILEKIQAIPFVERETEKGKNIMNTLVIVLIAAVWLLLV